MAGADILLQDAIEPVRQVWLQALLFETGYKPPALPECWFELIGAAERHRPLGPERLKGQNSTKALLADRWILSRPRLTAADAALLRTGKRASTSLRNAA